MWEKWTNNRVVPLEAAEGANNSKISQEATDKVYRAI
jgi:hypothetical protein